MTDDELDAMADKLSLVLARTHPERPDYFLMSSDTYRMAAENYFTDMPRAMAEIRRLRAENEELLALSSRTTTTPP